MTDSSVITEEVPAALAGERIDRAVSMIAGVARSEANRLISSGDVKVNGISPSKPSERVEEGAMLMITVRHTDDEIPANSTIDFGVVFSDDDVIVIDKPPHLIVHPGSGTENDTLVNGLLHRYPEIALVGQKDRPGIVHRLDKGTSGLLMVARSEVSYEHLVGQLAARSVTRRYVALVSGLVESEQGLIDAPLGRSPRDATLRAVVTGGKPARTRYVVQQRFKASGFSLVDCQLETGRTHQIRAHMKAIDHPIAGDFRYGGESVQTDLDRPFLHAATLEFDHPVSGQPLSFESDLPEDLVKTLSQLSSAEANAE